MINSSLINNIDSNIKDIIIKFANLRNINRYESKVGNVDEVTIDDMKLSSIVYYLEKQNMVQQLLDLGYSLDNEIWLKKMQDKMKDLHNIVQGFDRDASINPVVSEFVATRVIESIQKESPIIKEENKKGK